MSSNHQEKLNLNCSSKVSCNLPQKLILSICTSTFSERDNVFFRIQKVDSSPMEDCSLLAKNQEKKKRRRDFQVYLKNGEDLFHFLRERKRAPCAFYSRLLLKSLS